MGFNSVFKGLVSILVLSSYTLMPAFRFYVCMLMCLIISEMSVLCPASVVGLNLVRFVESCGISALCSSSCMNRMTNSKGFLVPMRRLTPLNRVLLREDSGFTLKKFSAQYGTHILYSRVYKSPLLVPVSSQMNAFDALPSHFFKIHFKINLPSTHMP
jgi:hypothetical protein